MEFYMAAKTKETMDIWRKKLQDTKLKEYKKLLKH